MKKIPLTKGKFALVNDSDYDWLSQWKWSYHSGGYACRRQHFPSSRNNQRYEIILMHRLVMGLKKGDNTGVDHKDGNPLNNQRENLRLCNQTLNLANTRKRRNTSSRYKGVSWYKAYSKWVVNLQKNGRIYHLGYFQDEVDAAKAYNQKALELFGEYARLNEVVR